MKNLIKWLFVTIILTLVVPLATVAQEMPCQATYMVQADDWLSNIADKFLGDKLAYPALVAATNQQHITDSSFAEIGNPDKIEIGWKICVPNSAHAQTLLAKPTTVANQPVTITDALGRKVEFATLPKRITVAGRAISIVADALYLFPEAKARLATVPRTTQNKDDFLAVVDPTFQQKILIEVDAGPEQVIATKPDAVVLKSYMAEKLGNPLSQLGIPVVYVDLETPAQYTRDIAIMGQLFGNAARAQQILSFYQQRLDRVQQATTGLTDTQKPRVLVLQYSEKNGAMAFNVPPTAWIQTQMVNLAGGQAIWTDGATGGGWTIVNFEQVAAWQADKIFIINYFGDVNESVKKLKADTKWQSLKAVQNGQLYGFPKDFYSWDQPDPRWILGLSWLATKLQADKMGQVDMLAEVKQFYTDMYGLDEATIQAKIVPLLNVQ